MCATTGTNASHVKMRSWLHTGISDKTRQASCHHPHLLTTPTTELPCYTCRGDGVGPPTLLSPKNTLVELSAFQRLLTCMPVAVASYLMNTITFVSGAGSAYPALSICFDISFQSAQLDGSDHVMPDDVRVGRYVFKVASSKDAVPRVAQPPSRKRKAG